MKILICSLIILLTGLFSTEASTEESHFESIIAPRRQKRSSTSDASSTAYLIDKIEFNSEEQQLGVEEHNRKRSLVNPPATNMLKLSFDQSLADHASKWSRKCIYEHNPNAEVGEFDGIGENLYLSTRITENFVKALNKGIELWFGEVEYYNYKTNECKPGKVCGHYTELVWAENYLVGCGISNCGNVTVNGKIINKAQYVVCNYAPGGNYYGEKPYKTGKSCSDCPKKNGCVCAASDKPTTDSPNTTTHLKVVTPSPTPDKTKKTTTTEKRQPKQITTTQKKRSKKTSTIKNSESKKVYPITKSKIAKEVETTEAGSSGLKANIIIRLIAIIHFLLVILYY